MDSESTRRRFLLGGATAGIIAIAGCSDDDTQSLEEDDDDETEPEPEDDDDETEPEPEDDDEDEEEEEDEDAEYEIWALDQGTDHIYFYEPDGDGFEETGSLDLNDHLDEFGQVPHMVDFSSDYEYAAVACTAGARTLVFRTEDKELVADLETGPSSHFAGFTPDDEHILVDVIADSKIVRIDADLDEEEFEIADELVIADDPVFEEQADEFNGTSPICHDHSNGYSYHTLGPGIDDAGVVVLDVENFELETVFPPAEIRTNCGTMAHPDEDKMYLTGGAPSNHEATGGVGEWYVLDTEENLPFDPESGETVDDYDHEDVSRDADGYDTHGFWFTPDADELWVLNRETDNGLVVDPETDEVIDEIDDYGAAPDIIWGSPDGEYMFVTLRGPDPVSGDPHAAEGETPGFSVMSVEDREIVEVVEPDEGNEDSDFHGIGVRVL